MPRSIRAYFRAFACQRGSTMVGYSSLALLVAIAAVLLLGHADRETGAPQQRAIGTVSSD
jgi:hypothetical protein